MTPAERVSAGEPLTKSGNREQAKAEDPTPGAGLDNPAARIRHYLNARYEHQARDETHGNVISHRVADDGTKHYLTAQDLEAVLQTLQMLAGLMKDLDPHSLNNLTKDTK